MNIMVVYGHTIIYTYFISSEGKHKTRGLNKAQTQKTLMA